jgi:hypothetical protein
MSTVSAATTATMTGYDNNSDIGGGGGYGDGDD